MKFGFSAYQILRVERHATAAQIHASHAELKQIVAARTDLPERVRANLQRSLDDALFTLSDPALRSGHDAWIARHENGARLDGAHSYILATPQDLESARSQAPAAAQVAPINRLANARAWLAALRKAGSAVRIASRTML